MNLETRLRRIERQHGALEGFDVAIQRSIIDDSNTAPEDRQKLIEEMPQLLELRARDEWYSRYDYRLSGPVAELLTALSLA